MFSSIISSLYTASDPFETISNILESPLLQSFLGVFLRERMATNVFFSPPEVVPFSGFKSFAATVQQLQKRRFLAQRLECCHLVGDFVFEACWKL